MAIWESNLERYQSRLEVFAYLCVNFHAYMNQRPDGTPVAPIKAPMWGNIPLEDNPLSLRDLENIRDTVYHLFDLAHCDPNSDLRYSITIDDFLEHLNWSFNPHDIAGLKIQYKTPSDPSKLPKQKRKHNKS